MSVHSFWPISWLMGTLQMGKIITHLFLDYMATFSKNPVFVIRNPGLSVLFYPLLEANFQTGIWFLLIASHINTQKWNVLWPAMVREIWSRK